MNIYVGNLSYQSTEDELRDLFAEFGDVVSAKLIADKFTGQSKGFGFVEMSNNSEAQKAMDELKLTCLHSITRSSRFLFKHIL